MLLLLALGVPQRPLAALEADLADFEAVLERGGKEPPEPIYASVDVRICSAIPKLERTFAHCKFRRLRCRPPPPPPPQPSQRPTIAVRF